MVTGGIDVAVDIPTNLPTFVYCAALAKQHSKLGERGKMDVHRGQYQVSAHFASNHER